MKKISLFTFALASILTSQSLWGMEGTGLSNLTTHQPSDKILSQLEKNTLKLSNALNYMQMKLYTYELEKITTRIDQANSELSQREKSIDPNGYFQLEKKRDDLIEKKNNKNQEINVFKESNLIPKNWEIFDPLSDAERAMYGANAITANPVDRYDVVSCFFSKESDRAYGLLNMITSTSRMCNHIRSKEIIIKNEKTDKKFSDQLIETETFLLSTMTKDALNTTMNNLLSCAAWYVLQVEYPDSSIRGRLKRAMGNLINRVKNFSWNINNNPIEDPNNLAATLELRKTISEIKQKFALTFPPIITLMNESFRIELSKELLEITKNMCQLVRFYTPLIKHDIIPDHAASLLIILPNILAIDALGKMGYGTPESENFSLQAKKLIKNRDRYNFLQIDE